VDSTGYTALHWGVISCHYEFVTELLKAGINTEIYPEFEKLGKQLKYASDRNIEYVIIIGPEEILQGKIKVKNLSTQIEEIMLIDDFINRLNNKIKIPHLI
jgi:histidyl-tRNA synthetase